MIVQEVRDVDGVPTAVLLHNLQRRDQGHRFLFLSEDILSTELCVLRARGKLGDE